MGTLFITNYKRIKSESAFLLKLCHFRKALRDIDRKYFLIWVDRHGLQPSNDVSGPPSLFARAKLPFLSSSVPFPFIHLSLIPSVLFFLCERIITRCSPSDAERGRAEIGHCGQMVCRRMMRDSNLVWIRPSSYNMRCPFCSACCQIVS